MKMSIDADSLLLFSIFCGSRRYMDNAMKKQNSRVAS
jgi:hypothetical protein